MVQLDDCLRNRPASFHEARDGRHLFVWGDLGQWLVVDAEVAELFSRFSDSRRVDEVVGECAQLMGCPYEEAVGKTRPVIDALVERGVLGLPPPAALPPKDPLRVSNLTFNITNRCNLSCPWCYNPPLAVDEVAVDDLLGWIAAGDGALDETASFIILGGEPFLDEARLLQVARGARKLFSGEILVSTNGTILDSKTPSALAEAGVTVQVSLDSSSAPLHDALRGEGVFDLAIDSIEHLLEAGVHTVLSMVLTRRSQEEIEAYFDLAAKIGVDEVRFIPLRRIGKGAAHADEVPDLLSCFRQIVDIIRRRPEMANMLHRDFFSILMTVCRYSRLRGNCGIARRCLFVDADGGIFPCPNHRDRSYRCGDVRTTPLARLLEESPVLGSLRQEYRLENMPACGGCAYRYWCAGDCRAEALAVDGKPGAPSPYCKAMKRMLPEMFWLLAEGWQGMGFRDARYMPWS